MRPIFAVSISEARQRRLKISETAAKRNACLVLFTQNKRFIVPKTPKISSTSNYNRPPDDVRIIGHLSQPIPSLIASLAFNLCHSEMAHRVFCLYTHIADW